MKNYHEMKTRLFTLIMLLAVSVTAFAQQKKTVAVLNPVCRDNSASNIYYSIVRGSFESVASATEGYETYDRTALDQIMQEHGFQRSGAVDETQIRELGKFAGVDYVLVTEISADEGYLMVVAKTLNVVTAKYDRSVDDLMEMTPPKVKTGCAALAQKLFKINMSTGKQTGEIMYNGYRYVGEFKDGKPNGKGKIYLPNNNYYDGEWSDGKPQGYGIRVLDELRYEGFFVNGEPHGNGKLFGPNGIRTEGTFNQGTITEGTFYFPSGDKYVGHLLDFLPYGNGTAYYSSGDKYVGTWKKGTKDGKGTYYYNDGKKYIGEFSNDMQHGNGTFFLQDGSKWVGTWVKGIMHGNFWVYMNGKTYHIKVVNGEPVEVLD